MTRKEIRDALPDDVRRNKPHVGTTLVDGAGEDWSREERPSRNGGDVCSV